MLQANSLIWAVPKICLMCLRNPEEKSGQGMTFSLNLEAWVGVGPTGQRPLWEEVQDRKRHFLFGKGGYI